MENDYEQPMQHGKQNVSSTLSMYPPKSNPPESGAPPPYSNPAQYPSTSGLPYPQSYPPQAPVMGYPQPYGPPPGGQPYYPHPGVVYPGSPAPSYQQQQQQQQQQTIVVNQPMGVAPIYVAGTTGVSMTGAFVLACIACWISGFLFGGIAFILAMVGRNSAAAGDIRGAIRLKNASITLSILGIVIAVIVVGVVVGLYTRRGYYYTNDYDTCCSYYYDYRYSSYRCSYYCK